MKKLILLVLVLILIVLAMDFEPTRLLYQQISHLKKQLNNLEEQNQNFEKILEENNLSYAVEMAKEVKMYEKIEVSPFIINDSGYTITKDKKYVHYALKLTNPNEKNILYQGTLRIVLKDNNNTILDVKEANFYNIKPKQDFCYVDTFSNDIKELATIEFEISTYCYNGYGHDRLKNKICNSSDLVISNIYRQYKTYFEDYSQTIFTGEITNTGLYDAREIEIYIICRKNGKIVGGYNGTVCDLNKDSTLPFLIFSDNDFINYDSYEVYAVVKH